MTVRSPQFQWIGDFEERGPSEDPDILLVGKVLLGGSPHVAKAVRVRGDERMPDFKEHVSPDKYEDLELDVFLDEIEAITGTIEPGLVTLESGTYLFCVMPAERSA